jgi:lipid-A-disaccharide synthase
LSARLFLSCGEPSGDLYAGALTRELLRLSPGATISGMGGPSFAAAGGQLLADYRGLAVTGFTEIVSKFPQLHRVRRRFSALAARERPQALVVIDYFGFNIRIARDLKALGIPVVYYVSPQIWAWRSGRIKDIRAVADRVLVIFPFEEAIYREAGVPCTFVGHPLVDLAQTPETKPAFLTRLGLNPEAPTVAILPGSRRSEVTRLLPTLVAATAIIRRAVPAVQFVFAKASGLAGELFGPARHVQGSALVEGATDAALAAADVVVTASGTATVQTALHDRPMVVVYRLSPLEYRVGRRFVKVDTFAMVNLIAGQRIVPELIQDACTADAVATETISMLTDTARATTIRHALADVRRKLGGPGASRRAAEQILTIAGGSCAQS